MVKTGNGAQIECAGLKRLTLPWYGGLYRLSKRPGGSVRPRKRKLNKRNAKSKTPAFHFQGDCEKRRKAPPNSTVSTKGEAGGGPCGLSAPARQSRHSDRALTSHLTILPVLRGAPRRSVSPRTAFRRGRENDCTAREARTGLLSPESHRCKHPITPLQTNREIEGSFNTSLFLCAQQH